MSYLIKSTIIFSFIIFFSISVLADDRLFSYDVSSCEDSDGLNYYELGNVTSTRLQEFTDDYQTSISPDQCASDENPRLLREWFCIEDQENGVELARETLIGHISSYKKLVENEKDSAEKERLANLVRVFEKELSEGKFTSGPAYTIYECPGICNGEESGRGSYCVTPTVCPAKINFDLDWNLDGAPIFEIKTIDNNGKSVSAILNGKVYFNNNLLNSVGIQTSKSGVYKIKEIADEIDNLDSGIYRLDIEVPVQDCNIKVSKSFEIDKSQSSFTKFANWVKSIFS